MSNVYHILTMATTQSNLLVFVHNVSRQQIYTHYYMPFVNVIYIFMSTYQQIQRNLYLGKSQTTRTLYKIM